MLCVSAAKLIMRPFQFHQALLTVCVRVLHSRIPIWEHSRNYSRRWKDRYLKRVEILLVQALQMAQETVPSLLEATTWAIGTKASASLTKSNSSWQMVLWVPCRIIESKAIRMVLRNLKTFMTSQEVQWAESLLVYKRWNNKSKQELRLRAVTTLTSSQRLWWISTQITSPSRVSRRSSCEQHKINQAIDLFARKST